MTRIATKAFTLIELLIVVAIIAILAAIAVPNFLEAQTRAKVSRVKSDMRALATALESYFVDHSTYPSCDRTGIAINPNPPQFTSPRFNVLERLSTPVAYMSSARPIDPFNLTARVQSATAAQQAVEQPTPSANTPVARANTYIYQATGIEGRSQTQTDGFAPRAFTNASAWFLHSAGPDEVYQNLGGVLARDLDIDGPIQLIYDPTNGTVSFGSIYRYGGGPAATSTPANPVYAGGVGLARAIDTQN